MLTDSAARRKRGALQGARRVAVLLGAGILACLTARAAEPGAARDALTQHRERRAEAAQRRRRIIFNNDGDDHLLAGDASVTAFLAERTTPLLGSQVDSVFYCTSRPFGMFLHDTKVGDVLRDRAPIVPGRTNIVPDLLAQGTDPLRLMVDYCHRQRLEIFWSMRMNDTHDTPHTPAQPHVFFSSFKKEHPDVLFGSPDKPPKYGSWTAVDYARPEVRDLLVRVFEEVCGGYDVDGVELDFFRHLVLFRSVAEGGLASAAERDMMTDLVRRIRVLTETEGMRRGRPILVAVRVPDSLEYCLGMGVDLERWLTEGLLDILVAGGDFQLNPWEYSTALGARHRVPVYCDLDPYVRPAAAPRFPRNSVEAYRGRARLAWNAGAAGIYIFNCFNPRDPLWWSIGDPAGMQGKDTYYFVNVIGHSGYLSAAGALPGGERYDHLPCLDPLLPLHLVPGAAVDVELRVAEDLTAARAAGLAPTTTCYLFTGLRQAPELSFNGTAVKGSRDAGDWFAYPVPPDLVRRGTNQLRLSRGPAPERSSGEWEMEWACAGPPPGLWSRDGQQEGTEAVVQDKALLIADRSTARGSYLYYTYPWGADPAETAVVELRARVLSGWSGILVCNGGVEEEVHLWPDRVEAVHAALSQAFDTTTAFHDYRIEIHRSDLRLYVDGKLLLDGTDRYTWSPHDARNAVFFGASNSTTTGEALWERVRLRTGTTPVHDLVLVVDYP
jgi:hypothetical protein